jgi:hypothetical protein
VLVVMLWGTVLQEFAVADNATVHSAGMLAEQSQKVDAQEKPAWNISWPQLLFLASVLLLVGAWSRSFASTNRPPLTPAEQKASQERLLDSYSTWKMWDAAARHDGAALTEEMKLVELRRIRRLNE